ncbi:MAG: response regulator transcription factor [Chitinophagaceae bacterium]|nr:response regulator transcription factor [Chitinophagaceae bacterium]
MTNESLHCPKILLCEDDKNLGLVLKNYLELNDYDVTLERDGRLGLAAFQREKFDICLLDVMMPHVDGFTLAKEIREIDQDIPMFFLTAKTMKDDILKGYNLGADDYITKPFDSEVLLLRIKAILKRNEEIHLPNANKDFHFGDFQYNPKLRQLIYKKDTSRPPTILTPKENKLMELLVDNQNNTLERGFLLLKIWGSKTNLNSRSLDVYVAKLRKHLKDDERVEIKNIHGEGFCFYFISNS